jgi:asparagine synthase (glutamine-hydrolysing)
MCGIVGIASIKSQLERDWLQKASFQMNHRGPDDFGVWWSNDYKVGLAHRRLSIIDLSNNGHQPMHNHDRGISIVFNGEIYNYRDIRKDLEKRGYQFRTNSDTEVIINAYLEWSFDCLSRFNGMFSIALYDLSKNVFLLARDRAGEKPLFYHLSDGTLKFASELKALLSNQTLSRRINPKALDCYLSVGYVPGEMCILEGYNKLPPAHSLIYNLNNSDIKIFPYWKIPDFDGSESVGKKSDSELLNELEVLLEAAVERQMTADVPVGILLSGGVDSSLITAFAAKNHSNVNTFSIGFQGYGSYDESSHSNLIAKHFATNHTQLTAEPSTIDLIPRLASQFDEPLVDSSMIPTYLVSRLVREHCTVALGGDGGDELFGGYNHHRQLLWMEKHFGFIPLPLRKVTSSIAENYLPVGLKGRNWLMGMGFDFKTGLPNVAGYFDSKTRLKLMSSFLEYQPVSERIMESRVPDAHDILDRITRSDFNNYLAEDILVKVDRSSMLNSLEVRAPMLDFNLIEFAFGKVPSRLKTSTNESKILLKRLAKKVLPPEFDLKRKQGFSIPLADWLKSGPYRDFFWDVLSDTDTLFDKRTINSLLKGQDAGYRNEERLFALVMLKLWIDEYKINY